MSVQVNQYHCFGYMLPYKEALESLDKKCGSEDLREEILDKFYDSAYNQDIVSIDGISLLLDGMGGKYLFFGKIFSKSKNHEFLDTIQFKKPKKHIKLLVEFKFKEYFDSSFQDVCPETYLITHYR